MLLLLCCCRVVSAQHFGAYAEPVPGVSYSQALQDSVHTQLILPKNLDISGNTGYPLLFLLDSQNPVNYTYSLQTVDYLTQLNAMPPCVLVGVALPSDRRWQWTRPAASGGQAEAFMDYLSKELAVSLGQQYPLANFNLLLGHSRTAIFAMYALSADPYFFDGAIASSAAYFDFGDTLQQRVFGQFLKKITAEPQTYYLLFSAGNKALGDAHDPSVTQLEDYMRRQPLPPNLSWACYRENVDHYTTPGFTVNRGLAHIFADYRSILPACFAILNDSSNGGTVPWDKYLAVYTKASAQYGFPIRPGTWFYNSIGSGYANDYEGIFGSRATALTLQVVQQAVADFPSDADFRVWLGYLYVEMGNAPAARTHLAEALRLLALRTDHDSQEMAAEIRQLLKEIK